jgi:hypothetical protein
MKEAIIVFAILEKYATKSNKCNVENWQLCEIPCGKNGN